MTFVFPLAVFLLLFLEAIFHFQLPILYFGILLIQNIYLYKKSNKKLYLVVLLVASCAFLFYWRSTTYSYFVQNSDPEVVANPELFASLIQQAQALNYQNYKTNIVIISVLEAIFKK